MKVIGADLGNETCKVVYGMDHKHKLSNSIKEVVDFGKRKDFGEQGEIRDNLDVTITSRHVNGRFYVGALASKMGETKVEPGKRKVHNNTLIIPFLTLLALNATDKKEELKACVGLPIKEYTDDRHAFEEKLRGVYKVKFNGPPFKEVEIDLKDVVALPEGTPVALNLALNDTGTKYRQKELLEKDICFADIGAFTTDLPVLRKGKADPDLSEAMDNGIAVSVDLVVEHIADMYKVNLTRSQMVQKLLEGDYKMSIAGQVVDTKPYFDKAFNLFATELLDKMDSMWSRVYTIEQFIVVGGGAIILKPYLLEKAKQFTERPLPLVFLPEEEDPQLQNALGYFKMAQRKFAAVKQP